MKTGAGFNPRLLDGTLTLPPQVAYMEGGLACLSSVVGPARRDELRGIGEFSLHIARAPFCEPETVQRAYVRRLRAHAVPGLHSVGFHLCGPLRGQMGRFGFGNPFVPDRESVRQAARFVDLCRQALDVPVVIENANFYDRDEGVTRGALEFCNTLCERAGVSQILDVAHVLMAASNLGIAAESLVRDVHLPSVSVVHLSGIVRAPNGVLHDGHQLPVDVEAWALFAALRGRLDHGVRVVIEHTDPRWSDADGQYRADFDRLAVLLANVPARRQDVDLDTVGIGYMANVVLPARYPQLRASMDGPSYQALVRAWAADFARTLDAAPGSVVAGAADLDLFDAPTIDPVQAFGAFVQRSLQ